jgi:hypothetical protein
MGARGARHELECDAEMSLNQATAFLHIRIQSSSTNRAAITKNRSGYSGKNSLQFSRSLTVITGSST